METQCKAFAKNSATISRSLATGFAIGMSILSAVWLTL
jgi:hypothetical protein